MSDAPGRDVVGSEGLALATCSPVEGSVFGPSLIQAHISPCLVVDNDLVSDRMRTLSCRQRWFAAVTLTFFVAEILRCTAEAELAATDVKRALLVLLGGKLTTLGYSITVCFTWKCEVISPIDHAWTSYLPQTYILCHSR